MNAPIKKAVIPVAGLGTRFLPATKTVPKEMLPIVDRPALLYNIEECARAGIEDVILIAGRNKTAIEDFFDTSYELEDTLLKQNKSELLRSIQNVKNLVNIISIRQKEALGLGHAILSAKPVTGDQPFAVLLGDEIMFSDADTPSAIGELCSLFAETGLSSVAAMEVPLADVVKYGIIKHEPLAANRWRVLDVVEKPSPADAPSRMALPGRYVFDGHIMNELAKTKPGKNGEIQLTDGMKSLATQKGLLATTVKALRFDTGDKLGFLSANIELALRREDLRDELSLYIKKLANQI